MNKIIICGNITRDVEIITANNGTQITKFSVAVQRRFKKEDGTHDVDFFNCSAFGNLGTEVIAKYCKKGSKVLLTGRMESSTKDDDGKKIVYWNFMVDDVELVGSKASDKGQENQKPFEPVDDDSLPF